MLLKKARALLWVLTNIFLLYGVRANISNMSELFITSRTLENNPLSTIAPSYQRNCTHGTSFYWEPVNETLPYYYMYFNNIAYSIASNIRGPTCDICICTAEGECYHAINNDNFQVDFIPYCFDNECYMFAIVHSFPLDLNQDFVDTMNKTYNAPIPYLTNFGPLGGYMKAYSVSCEGCVLQKNLTCKYEYSLYNGTSAPLSELQECQNTSSFDVQWLIIKLCCIPLPLVPFYIVVLYIFWVSPEFKGIVIYKLMVLHGIANLIFYFSYMLSFLSTVYPWEGYWFVLIFALNNSSPVLLNLCELLLALNRWDILGGLDLFPLFDRGLFFKIAVTVVIIIFFLNFTINLIPGFREFPLYVLEPFCKPGMLYITEVFSLPFDNYFFVYELQISLGVSFLLYIWCVINIIIQLSKTSNNPIQKEVLLFLQTLIPCFLLILGNVYSYIFFVQNPPDWCFIVWYMAEETISLQYPILYTALNKTLRKELKNYVKNWYHKIFNKNGSTTTQITVLTTSL